MKNRRLPIVKPNILILEGLWSDTADAVRAAGGSATEGSPWDMIDTEMELLSGRYHGLILTGGSDINPALYTNDNRHPEVYGVDNTRDAVEWKALQIALKLGLPVLGICRGSQIMTAFRGGTLVQHLGSHHRGTDHVVHASSDARTFPRAAQARTMEVVSLHHQCVLDAGPGMRIAAYAPDGTPEAVESTDGLWLGCQFHPEITAFTNVNSYSIFRWIVGAAAAFAGGRAQSDPFRVARRRKDYFKGHRYPGTRELGSGWDDQAWGSDVRTTSTREYVDADATEITVEESEDGTRRFVSSPPRKPRKAGEPSLPSMRHTETTGARPGDHELLICPRCAMVFDHIEDRDDHLWFLHGYTYDYVLDDYIYIEPMRGLQPPAVDDYVEPPADDPAWEPHARDNTVH